MKKSGNKSLHPVLPDRCSVKSQSEQEYFAALYKTYYSYVYRMAGTILNDPHDCEEVVQDSFFRAYKYLKKFRGKSSFITWLCRIVINQAKNRYGIRKREEQWQEFCEFLHSGELGNSGSANIYDLLNIIDVTYDEYVEVLRYNITLLPEKLQKAIQLRYIENMNYEDIARELKCATGTVKSRISRGRKQLITLMREFDW